MAATQTPDRPATIPFVRDFAFAYGVAEGLTPLIERVVAHNPGPFTFTGTATFIVGPRRSGARVAVIDPGPWDMEHLEVLLDATHDRAIAAILLTHTHLDHAPLATALAKRTDAPILGARPIVDAPTNAMDMDDAVDLHATALLTDGETVSGDGWTLRTVATPGHASNHLAFWLEEERSLFSGDHVMGWSTTIVAPPDGDMQDYLHSLRKVIELEPDTIWPTHGPPITAPQPFLQAYLQHRLAREAQIVARLHSGDRTVGQMTPVLYAAVDRNLWPAASLSILAHLIALHKDGRVRAEPGPGLDAKWRLV